METIDDPRSSTDARTLPGRRSASPAILVLAGIGVAMGLALLVSLVLYLRYSYVVYPTLNFNSDDAGALLFSSEVLKQHSLFPDWYNATGIAFPLISPELLLLPLLLAVSDHWMACFRTAVAVDQLLMSVLIWWVLGRVGASRVLRLFLLCFLFASVSSWMAEQTVMISGKDWFFAQMLLLSYLTYRCLQREPGSAGKPDWGRFAWLGGVATVLFIDKSNISQMLPPLIVAVAALWAIRFGTQSSRPTLTVFAALVLAAVAGQLIFHFLLPQAVSYKPIAPTFVDLDAAGANLQLLVRGLLELFGAAPVPGESIYAVASIWWAVKLGLLCIVFLGPLWLLTRWRRLESDFLRLLVVVFVVSLALRVLVYVFTGISVGITQTNRYFISDALVGVTVMLLYFEQHWRRLPVRAGMLAVAAILVSGSPLLVAKPADGSQQHKLARFLESKHLDHGYATFWNAGVLTALSDNRVQVRQILLGAGDIQPFKWLSSSRWYQGNPDIHESFLLLKGAEQKFNLRSLQPILGKPVRVENYGDYRAVVYPFDIAERLGWKLASDKRLPAADRHASIQILGAPVWSGTDHRWTITVRVTNLGALPIGSDGSWPVNLGVHLLGSNGQMLDHDYGRVALPMIASGKSATVSFEPPDNRANGNILEFDPVQENVAWFSGAGNRTLKVRVPQPPPPG